MSRVHPGKRKHVFDAPGYSTHYNSDDAEIQALKKAQGKNQKAKFVEHNGILVVWCGSRWVHWESADPKLIGRD